MIYILALGVFGVINTEMGFIGILPAIVTYFHVTISQASLLISIFALIIALAGPTMPLLLSRFNRKYVMLFVLGIFIISNLLSIWAKDFTTLLVVRMIPAFVHPVYCSLGFTIAAASVAPEFKTKAVAKIVVGVSAGMVVGVPISNYLASTFSLQTALSSFAIVNIIVFLLTMVFVPSMPVREQSSYSGQISILKRTPVLMSILAVILLNGSVFGVFNYLAEYLERVTNIAAPTISLTLFIYGIMNIIGSVLAGGLLAKNALRTVRFFICALLFTYIILSFIGNLYWPTLVLTIFWGILGGLNGNITQYWITHAAPDAPDFANGLFLTAANLGTTFATMLGSFFIMRLGISSFTLVGMIFIILASIIIFIQLRLQTSTINY